MNSNNMLQPVLISGLLFGVLTAMPPFSFINVCSCCSLYAVAGGFAAWLWRRNPEVRLTPGSGSVLGALTGLVGGLAQTAISLPLTFILQKLGGAASGQAAERISDLLGDQNPEAAEMLRKFLENSQSLGLMFVLIKFFTTIFFFSLFAALGGVLAASLFKDRTMSPAYPQPGYVPPVPMPPLPDLPSAGPEPEEPGGSASPARNPEEDR